MLATLILARVARVKIDRFHRALLLSFALYVGIFAVALRPLLDWGLDGGLFQRLEPFGFLALVCWWAYIAVRGTSRSDHPRRPGSGPLPDAADLATGRRPPLSPHERAALAAATT